VLGGVTYDQLTDTDGAVQHNPLIYCRYSAGRVIHILYAFGYNQTTVNLIVCIQ
jgi:hypothetical protein